MQSVGFRVFAIFLLSFGAPWPAAIRAGTQPATLEQAIRLGLERNPGLAALRARADATASDSDAAAAARWPVLTAGAGLRRTNHPVMVFGDKLTAAEFMAGDFALDHLNHPDAITHANAALSLQVPLYTSGRITSSIAASRDAARAMKERVRAAESDLASQITEAYFGVPLAAAAAGVAESALADARGHESMASARFEAGASLRSDFLRAQVLRLSRERDLDKKRADLGMARARLRRMLGLAPGEEIEPTGSLDAPAGEIGELDAWIGRAADSRAEIAAARLEAEAAGSSERSARASLGPEIDGLAQYERNVGGLDAGEGSWLVGLNLRWSAFDRGRASRVSAASARRAAAELDTRAVEDAVRQEVEQAYRDAVVAERGLSVTREMAAAAEAARRITADRYAGGLQPITDLLDVETQLESARLGELAAKYDAVVGRARLMRSGGVMEVSR